MNPKTIGTKLKLLRADKTLNEVSKETGITVSALSNYENGQRIPRDEVKLILARFYGKKVEEIFFTD